MAYHPHNCRPGFRRVSAFETNGVALYEPLPYMTDALHHTGVLSSLRIFVGPLFAANLIAAYIFRKYGFLAPLVMRLSFYLIWHIIYGGLM